MEESYETFEEELWPPPADPPPPHKPVRQTRRPEMYSNSRRMREEVPPLPQQLKSEPKVSPRDPGAPRTTPPPRPPPGAVQDLSQTERPWENVTLNRCLFVAITILVLTSGFQRLNENLRGQRSAVEEEDGGEVRMMVRRTGALRHRGPPPEPETSLWDVVSGWLPDFDDDDEDDDDGDEDEDGTEVKTGKSKRGDKRKAASVLRNKPLPDKKLMKKRGGTLKERRTKKAKEEEEEEQEEQEEEGLKGRQKEEEEEEEEDEEDEEEKEEEEKEAPKKTKKKQKKEKKKM